MPTVREVTYSLLRELGMTKIFGNPGSSELPFLKDMPADFQYVLALHERVAMLKGLNVAALERTWQGVRLTQGALELVAEARRVEEQPVIEFDLQVAGRPDR